MSEEVNWKAAMDEAKKRADTDMRLAYPRPMQDSGDARDLWWRTFLREYLCRCHADGPERFAHAMSRDPLSDCGSNER